MNNGRTHHHGAARQGALAQPDATARGKVTCMNCGRKLKHGLELRFFDAHDLPAIACGPDCANALIAHQVAMRIHTGPGGPTEAELAEGMRQARALVERRSLAVKAAGTAARPTGEKSRLETGAPREEVRR